MDTSNSVPCTLSAWVSQYFYPFPKELLKPQVNYFCTFQKHSAYPQKTYPDICIPQNQMPQKYLYNNNKSAHEITSSSSQSYGENESQWLGRKISMLFFRRYVYNLELPISDSLSKEVMADINALTVGSSHRVVRQVYHPLVILLHRGISNIAIRKNETPDIPHKSSLANSRGHCQVLLFRSK